MVERRHPGCTGPLARMLKAQSWCPVWMYRRKYIAAHYILAGLPPCVPNCRASACSAPSERASAPLKCSHSISRRCVWGFRAFDIQESRSDR